MPSNLDLVRSIYASWDGGIHAENLASWADPGIEYVIADGPEPGRWTGLAAMTEAWRNFLGGIEDYQVAADECREIDAERVLVLHRFGGRGMTSGLDVATNGAQLFHIRCNKVTRLVFWWDRNRALADLGLDSENNAPSP